MAMLERVQRNHSCPGIHGMGFKIPVQVPPHSTKDDLEPQNHWYLPQDLVLNPLTPGNMMHQARVNISSSCIYFAGFSGGFFLIFLWELRRTIFPLCMDLTCDVGFPVFVFACLLVFIFL